MALAAQWTFRGVDRDTTYRLFYGHREAGTVRWAVPMAYPSVTMQRIVDGLNGTSGCEARTWGWRRVGVTMCVELLHNGRPVGEIEWPAELRNKTKWSTRAVDGMNRQLAGVPFPEPAPPAPPQPRHLHSLPRYVDGDFDVTDPTWNGRETA